MSCPLSIRGVISNPFDLDDAPLAPCAGARRVLPPPAPRIGNNGRMVRPGKRSTSCVLVLAFIAASTVACRSEKKDAANTQAASSAPLVLAPSPSSEGPMAAPVPDAEKIIAGLRPYFRLCYRAGLMTDPELQGSVVMDARIAADGSVTGVTQHAPTTLSPPVTHCLEEALKGAQFSPPGGTGSTVRVPLNFRRAVDGGL